MEVDFVWRTLKYLNKKGIKSWCKTDKYFSGDDPSLDGCYRASMYLARRPAVAW